jgi:protein gp37
VAESAIEWTDVVWNSTTGCDRISPGCDNCYALTMAKRLKAMGQAKYQTDGDPRTSGPGFGLAVHPDALDTPLHWRNPRKVFVNSMSDLFHARVPREFLAEVFATMAFTPQHTYQVLTKRPERMRRILTEPAWWSDTFAKACASRNMPTKPTSWVFEQGRPAPNVLRNVWLGTSIESDKYIGRADDLRATPAAVRFLSLEPLLGPLPSLDLTGIDWVIAGGESGPGARPMHPDWVRSLRDRCESAGVAFFFKQWGEYGIMPRTLPNSLHSNELGITVADDGTVYQPGDLTWPDGPRWGEAVRAGHDHAHLHAMYRVGKHAAGRELDGRTHDAYPEAGNR